MVYIASDGSIQRAQPWSLSRVVSWFWGCVDFFVLFLKTLVSPDTNRRGPQYTTDYRRPGGPSPPPAPRRRLGGFGSGGTADLSSLPCGTGG
ncbi:selenoprotein K-like isoform X2 [Schistocerca gregaria]|uniref:selenoprotein K-like isoform X2 n=1 Tax=Schistocerca gregaria TaxID=7010 RepID=UPI00211E8174|nr:selenoprotein K-like isoform X2 [Schistocerca gregaria]